MYKFESISDWNYSKKLKNTKQVRKIQPALQFLFVACLIELQTAYTGKPFETENIKTVTSFEYFLNFFCNI